MSASCVHLPCLPPAHLADAQNPTDWKHIVYASPEGSISGCDFSGTVVAASPSSRDHVKVGQRVAGDVYGGKFPDQGSFAQYLVTEPSMCWRVPDSVKQDQAASYGVPLFTAFQALQHSQRQPWPPVKERADNPEWIVIYGGSSGVGMQAVQLAKALGYKVAATASKHNFDLVKGYGADEVFDYHDGEAAIAAIKKATGGGVRRAMDCISLAPTAEFTAKCFAPEGGQANFLLAIPQEVKDKFPKIEFVTTMLYGAYGVPYSMGPRDGKQIHVPADPELKKWFEQLMAKTPGYIEEGLFKPPPFKVRSGLDNVNAGLKEMQDGKISGERLVYKI